MVILVNKNDDHLEVTKELLCGQKLSTMQRTVDGPPTPICGLIFIQKGAFATLYNANQSVLKLQP